MKHVYLVIAGRYENEHVAGIFSTEEKASAHASTLPKDDDYEGFAEIERREIDNPHGQ